MGKQRWETPIACWGEKLLTDEIDERIPGRYATFIRTSRGAFPAHRQQISNLPGLRIGAAPQRGNPTAADWRRLPGGVSADQKINHAAGFAHRGGQVRQIHARRGGSSAGQKATPALVATAVIPVMIRGRCCCRNFVLFMRDMFMRNMTTRIVSDVVRMPVTVMGGHIVFVSIPRRNQWRFNARTATRRHCGVGMVSAATHHRMRHKREQGDDVEDLRGHEGFLVQERVHRGTSSRSASHSIVRDRERSGKGKSVPTVWICRNPRYVSLVCPRTGGLTRSEPSPQSPR